MPVDPCNTNIRLLSSQQPETKLVVITPRNMGRGAATPSVHVGWKQTCIPFQIGVTTSEMSKATGTEMRTSPVYVAQNQITGHKTVDMDKPYYVTGAIGSVTNRNTAIGGQAGSAMRTQRVEDCPLYTEGTPTKGRLIDKDFYLIMIKWIKNATTLGVSLIVNVLKMTFYLI